MAPKKLTDCPENLRESIDWLIQVRHGNGKGLEHLAKALNRLIEDAIANAYTTNVDALLKVLDPAKSYKCCKDKVTKIEELKDSKSLKNNPFNGLKTSYEGIRNCYKSHLDPSQQKSYDEIDSKLDQLKNLKENLKGITVEKNCKELLTNLCDGLEKFLGFNSASKGYDGSGIVYSDLDRLCDAVMGFLYQVLKDVRDNKNLSPYKNTLETAVNTLNENLNKGKNGVEAVIDDVESGITGWLGEVDRRNRNVTGPLDKLMKNIFDLHGAMAGLGNREYDDVVVLFFGEWIDSVQRCPPLSKKSSDAIGSIDKHLSKDLTPHVNLIVQATESFKDNAVADYLGLRGVCQIVDKEFKELDKVVADGLGDETGLKKKIDGDVKALKNNVNDEYPKQLKESIKNAKQTLTDAKRAADEYLLKFEHQKNEQFDEKLKAIEALLKDIDKSKNTTGVHQPATHCKLYDEVSALTGMISDMETQVQKGAAKIGGVIDSAVKGVHQALGTLNQKIKEDLQKLKSQIDLTIKSVIDTLKEKGVKKIVDNIKLRGSHIADADELVKELREGLNTANPRLEALFNWARQAGQRPEITEALNGLRDCGGGRDFTKLRLFLEKLEEDIGAADGKSFYGALIADIQNTVVQKLQGAHSHENNVKKLLANYTQWVTGIGASPPGDSLKAKIEAIKTDIEYYFQEGIKENNSSQFNLSDGGRFGTYHQTKESATQAIQLAVEKITKLEELPGKVSDAKTKIENFINEIKNQYESLKQQVEETIETLTKAGEQLTQMIREINSEIDEFHNKAKRYIDEFCQQYKTASNKASTNIKKSALSQFANSKADALQKLKELVERENEAIKKIIEKDLESGLKGMMKKMKAVETFLDTFGKQTELRTATPQVRMYLEELLQYVEGEVQISTGQQKKDTVASTKIANVKAMLGMLLDDLSSSNHFDHTFSRNLADFTDSLSALQPFKFTGHNHPELPDAMKGGLRRLVGELGRAYVNVYSGQKIDWERNERGKRNCAKVCITISHTLFHELYCLFYYGATKWKSFDFTGSATKEDNKHALQEYLEVQGYNVENLINKQNSGWDVALTLRKSFKDKYEFHTPPDKSHTNFNLYLASIDRANGFVAQLFDYVERYYKLCHISDSSAGTQPCSVYQMLIWLNGLPHRSVYDKLNFDYFSELFEKPDSADTEGIELEGLSLSDLNAETLAAYPHDVTVTNLTEALTDVCSQSYYLLTSFLGHGHANGVYACDYSNNAFNLSYPSSPGACFEMLVDFVNRLYRQLFFLYTQCSNEENCSGWRNCWYGQHVGGSAWNCNTMQCPNQKGNQNHKQTCNQKCDQTVECGIKSPLQSFLEDGLPGFLPHSFSKPGCKLTCTVSNHRGLPCITPMGFADLSVAASCTQQGVHLKNILKDFCGTKAAPLTQLCAQLTCLLQKPPQTLGDTFAFYYSYLEEWADGFYGKPPKTSPYTKAAFNDAVTEANFREQYSGFNPSILVSTSKHGEEHSKGNLCSIANCKSGSAVPCGLYVKSVTQEISKYYSSEHKANHLSWIVYITETFYDLLKKLYDDCCNKCGPTGSKCYTKSCDEKCSVKYTDSTGKPTTLSPTHNHSTYCKSIVTCRDTHPILYRYGFTFGHPWGLNGSGNNEGAKRTCKDFCEALKLMLDENSVLIALRKQIDKFLWDIREKFSFTILALWLLSLLYLLHIMVIRLDLLHIKSHLHSPSSHRIAAQSLLAAARAGKLSKISYLQA